ncbi:MAG: prepilin peptidase [Armatimonadota bacterium]|nr:prepilin peptidase [Armatimonadota bacterium]
MSAARSPTRGVRSLGPTSAAQIALLAVVFLMGAAIGSFLNVVIFRLPRRESLLSPPSRCLSCGERLGVVDLFPVFSYLALRGRCRHCGRPFSARYMVVELAMGLSALGAWHVHGPTLQAPLLFVVVCCLIVVFFIDLDHYIIPDEAVAIIAVVGVLVDGMRLVAEGGSAMVLFHERLTSRVDYTVLLPRSVVGAAVGAGLLIAIAFVAERVFKRPAMGWGDVKLAGAMGALLGPGYQFLTYFLLSVMIGALVGVVCMALGRCGRRDYLPFGPMMAAAGVAMVYFGDVLTPAVMSRFAIG